tara:strand:+ start:83 stop:415 length:333 start_codon:yes stop_codon:yes gene_type:complete
MKWPPLKAWTSIKSLNGSHHFVAINYGGDKGSRWMNLVSVLDGSIRLKVYWSDFSDKSQWVEGWKTNNLTQEIFQIQHLDTSTCLHPSNDSGLSKSLSNDEIRDWFESNN